VKVAIFTRIVSNTLGGMEKQILSIADGLIRRGHSVIIVSLDTEIPVPFFEANPEIRFIPISEGNAAKPASFKIRIRRQRKVLELLKRENISVSLTFMTGSYWYAVIPSLLCRIPVVLAERNSPAIYNHIQAGKRKHLIFFTMIFSSLITIQFESFRTGYPKFLHRKIVCVPNQIPSYFVSKYSSMEKFCFVFAGRFSHQKQILELIQAFISFHTAHTDTILEIYGDGELKQDVIRIIDQNSASNYIFVKSSESDIQVILREATVLVAPSLWEGFPNSVAEALSYGVPVGGFKDCDGVRDLIVNRGNGWLVERKDPIKSIQLLLEVIYDDKSNITNMRSRAKTSMEKYCGESANIQWESLLKNLK
jgi:glycosyltransferase involved in cell wall biosynthesis